MVMPLQPIWILAKREPVTLKREKLFVAVCRGEREPVTDAERVWSKYMTRIGVKQLPHLTSGGKPQVERREDYEADVIKGVMRFFA